MVNLVKLHFDCIVECDYQYADDLGSDIATDLLNEWDNGVDYLEWVYTGSELMESQYINRIIELEHENEVLRKTVDMLRK